jgi:hypothetical protein
VRFEIFTAVLIRSKSSAVSTSNSDKTSVPMYQVTWHNITKDLACQKCSISHRVVCGIWSSLLAWFINLPHKLCSLCGVSGSHNGVVEVFSLPRCHIALLGSNTHTRTNYQDPWKWDQYAVLKHQQINTKHCCWTSQYSKDLICPPC